MKKFKFALMCAAALALVACEPKPGNEPDEPTTDEPIEDEYVSPVKVDDNSLADWDNLPAEFVFTAANVEGSSNDALNKITVYADEVYINILVEYNTEHELIDKAVTPFHLYFNADNDATTGGWEDQWTSPDIDIMFEGALFSEGAAVLYEPLMFAYGDAPGTNVWSWSELTQAAPVCASQWVGDKLEIQLLWELIPATWGDAFTMGADIQDAGWNSVGFLPNAADDELGNKVLVEKMLVTFDK